MLFSLDFERSKWSPQDKWEGVSYWISTSCQPQMVTSRRTKETDNSVFLTPSQLWLLYHGESQGVGMWKGTGARGVGWGTGRYNKATSIQRCLIHNPFAGAQKITKLIKPVLNWANVSSPNIFRTVWRTYDSFLNWTFSSPNMVRTVRRTMLR